VELTPAFAAKEGRPAWPITSPAIGGAEMREIGEWEG
jgi:hypothetical protein